MTPSGKTLSLISRLPAFYAAGQTDSLFYQLLSVFGEVIEAAEIDLYRVLRAHHVGTATNEGSLGFNTNQQGDLDRIFSLYLEALGGTSLLTEIDPQFRPNTFKDVSGLLTKLQRRTDPLSQSIAAGLSATHGDRLMALSLPLEEEEEPEWRLILTEEFNRCLVDPTFYPCNRDAFVLNGLPTTTRRLIQQAPEAGKDLAVLNRALLEAAYPNELESVDAPYRERLLAMIRVLRRGAATKQGIRDIVAANLGIFEEDEAAQAAKEQIQVEEYLPELIFQSSTLHPYSEPPAAAPIQQTFEIHNPNVLPTIPGFRLRLRDVRQSQDLVASVPFLIGPRFVNIETGQSFGLELCLKINDVLRIQPDGMVLVNGVRNDTQLVPPLLPLGTSIWRVEFKLGEVVGRFDEGLFDLSRFDRIVEEPKLLNLDQAMGYQLDLTVELTKITPGTFRVRIPWNLPGFTDRFTERQDHPRSQIAAIINKVKAAGVMAVITYEQHIEEDHQMDDLEVTVP